MKEKVDYNMLRKVNHDVEVSDLKDQLGQTQKELQTLKAIHQNLIKENETLKEDKKDWQKIAAIASVASLFLGSQIGEYFEFRKLGTEDSYEILERELKIHSMNYKINLLSAKLDPKENHGCRLAEPGTASFETRFVDFLNNVGVEDYDKAILIMNEYGTSIINPEEYTINEDGTWVYTEKTLELK